jgi:TolB-like protein
MIAVIPFEHQGPEEWEYFADGLADAIGGKLAGLPGLAVIDRRSSAQYKGSRKTVQQIGQELGVEYVLEGVVRWTSDGDTALGARRAVVTPTLVRTHDARIQWADEPVSVTLTDPVKAQVDIASSVANKLGIALRPIDRERLARRPTRNPAAYDAFVRGDLVYRSWDGSVGNLHELQGGVAALERAVRLDTAFALAWARLAVLRALQAERYSSDSREFTTIVEASRRDAARAVQLDPSLPDGHAATSLVKYLDGDDAGSREAVARAVALGPVDATTLALHGGLRSFAGHQDGYDIILEATRLGPRSVFAHIQAVQMAWRLKRPDDVDRHARAVLALDSLSGTALRMFATGPLLRGDSTLAHHRLLEIDRTLGPQSDAIIDLLWRHFGEAYRVRFASTFARASVSDSMYYYELVADKLEATGHREASLAYRDSIVRLAESRDLTIGPAPQGPLGHVAQAYAALGNRTEALRYRSLADSILTARAVSLPERCANLQSGAAVMSLIGNRDSAITLFSRRLAEPCGRNAAFYRALGPSRDVVVYRMRGYPPFDRILSQE